MAQLFVVKLIIIALFVTGIFYCQNEDGLNRDEFERQSKQQSLIMFSNMYGTPGKFVSCNHRSTGDESYDYICTVIGKDNSKQEFICYGFFEPSCKVY